MTGWTAILPFNYGRPRKTRLAALLSPAERDALAMAMARHVARVLGAAPSVAAVHLLSPVDPDLPATIWVADRGAGLNAELDGARRALGQAPVLFVHADLPLLAVAEVEAMIAAASASGAAIARDAAGMGTNALALADGRPLMPAFGAESFAAHRAALPDAAIVAIRGLLHDIDDADSLKAAVAHGFVLPFAAPAAAPDRIAPSGAATARPHA